MEETNKIRRNKKQLFNNERNNIINNLNNIIKLNENNNSILLIELQNNENLKKYLIEIINDIKKYYRCCRWGYFVCENNGKKGDEITLLRAIYKDHNYTIPTKEVLIDYNGIKKKYTKLFFIKNNLFN
jgi:hypothetical protein